MDTTHTPQHVAGLPNGLTPIPGVVTGGQPREGYIDTLAEKGFRTVIDLRMSTESRGFDEAAAVRAAGMEYVSLPVETEIEDETFARFRELMRDKATYPVLVHCGSGNRVGALLIPYLMLEEGRDIKEALELAIRVGLRSNELIAEALTYVARSRAEF